MRFLVLLLLAAPACATYNPGILRTEVKSMAATVADSIEKNPELRTVAVTPMKGDDPDLSHWFAREVEAELVSSEGFAVVDRQNLEEILEEHHLVLSDVFSEDRRPEIGRLLGANGLVVTEVNPNDDKSYYSLRARLIEMETGRILVSDSSTLAARDFEFTEEREAGDGNVFTFTGNVIYGVVKLPLTPVTMILDIFETACIDEKGVGSRLSHEYSERVLIGIWAPLPIPFGWIGGIFHNDLYLTRSMWRDWF